MNNVCQEESGVGNAQSAGVRSGHRRGHRVMESIVSNIHSAGGWEYITHKMGR